MKKMKRTTQGQYGRPFGETWIKGKTFWMLQSHNKNMSFVTKRPVKTAF